MIAAPVKTCVMMCWAIACIHTEQGRAQSADSAPSARMHEPAAPHDGQHDFDFEIGTWKTHFTRLVHPLTGSRTWLTYDGTTTVTKVWNGHANLVELVADGPDGHFEGLNLRLYNPEGRQWSLNYSNVRSGTLSQPTVGEFRNGRGEFYDQEMLNGRAILVRFVITNVTRNSCFVISTTAPNVCRFEQSFSDDGGKTWETNWIATDTRIRNSPVAHRRRMRAPTPVILAALFVGVSAMPGHASAQARTTPIATSTSTQIRVTWLGHAGFEIVSPGGTRLLIDPWIEGNSAAPNAYRDSARYSAADTRPAAILVTHGHGDHDANVPRLARLSGAPVVATGDHLEAMKIPEGHYLSINIGGVQHVGDVEINAVPAMHSVAPGHALGYVLRFADGRTLYHTGDTWVFGDMALIEELFHPSVVLFGMGGGRSGESPTIAAFAIRTYFHPKIIVPMHFGTFAPPFATEQDVRSAFRDDPRLRVLTPGREVKF